MSVIEFTEGQASRSGIGSDASDRDTSNQDTVAQVT